MKIDLIIASEMFSVAELSAMELNFEVFRFHKVYAAFGFVETADLRAKYISLVSKKRARAFSATGNWVRLGGALPEHLDVVDDR